MIVAYNLSGLGYRRTFYAASPEGWPYAPLLITSLFHHPKPRAPPLHVLDKWMSSDTKIHLENTPKSDINFERFWSKVVVWTLLHISSSNILYNYVSFSIEMPWVITMRPAMRWQCHYMYLRNVVWYFDASGDYFKISHQYSASSAAITCTWQMNVVWYYDTSGNYYKIKHQFWAF